MIFPETDSPPSCHEGGAIGKGACVLNFSEHFLPRISEEKMTDPNDFS